MNDEHPVQKSIPLQGWKIRFDAPPPQGAARAADRGNILALFRAWEGATRNAPREQRRTPRYTPTETRAWVGWWRRGHFLVSRAELVNLSEGGARLRLAQQPPTSVPVWVCLGSPHPTDYLQARVLETCEPGPADAFDTDLGPGAPPSNEGTPADTVSLAGTGEIADPLPYLSRLAFHAPCPASFFNAAGRRREG